MYTNVFAFSFFFILATLAVFLHVLLWVSAMSDENRG